MADIIQLLPDHVANQIAAGEVVQRPASVVKELLENAIDAGATQIKLIVKDAGKALIQVVDNGKGMSTTDARLCFERHATSKIRTAEDLFQLHTKGFRGEALASIAAIAHVELKTNPDNHQDGEAEIGTTIRIEGSEVLSQEAAVTPKGTSITVKNLFFNVPARRNFLKSNTVEIRHIIDEFHRVALAHPGIAFTMLNNGAEVFNLSASNLRQRIVSIYGGKTNEKLVPIDEETEIVTIKGFVIKPEFAKKSRGEQFFFINNRYIKNGYLHHAVTSAFEGLLKDGLQPGYFLFLEMNPKSIDINIHPTKTEVKFDDEHTLYAILRASVKHSLGQFNVAPVLDFERDKNLDIPYEYSSKPIQIPDIEVDRDFNPFEEKPKTASGQKTTHFSFQKEKVPSWESLYTGLKNDDIFSSHQENTAVSSIEVESEEVTGTLFADTESQPSANTFQLQNKYILTTIKDGFLIVHQQLAHERVLYEELLRNMTVKEAASQQLLFPLELHFTPAEVSLIGEIKEQLEHTGFVFENIDKESVSISGIPVNINGDDVKNILDRLIDDLQNEVPDSSFSQNDLLAKSMAKSLAVKTGMPLPKEQQEHLVNSLFACKEPSVSPAGKTVFIRMTTHDLDRKFG